MKSTLSAIALAALVTLAPLIQAHDQTSNVSPVNVPFGFNQGTNHFAAGTYKIGIYSSCLLSLTDSNGYTSFVMARPSSDSGSSVKPGYVAFRRYGNTYFLAGYHVARGVTMTSGESKTEQIVAHDLASNPRDAGLVQLALLHGPVVNLEPLHSCPTRQSGCPQTGSPVTVLVSASPLER